MSAPPQLDTRTTTPTSHAPFFRRIPILLTLFLTLLVLALLPPYLNVNRLQRRITTSISASLGRPVHFDNVTLNLLPIPSFTIDNFVVSEDPTFGYEPTIRANTVTARLRVSTLWRRRIEFSRITFTEPSVNLVHTADGKWNLDSILLQASRVSTAPTAQPSAGPAPRFPYIEATGARLNLKLDQVKTPFSLTEADFALWLPGPETWHFRITARPARTDVPVGYSGLLHLEGTLGSAPTLSQIPLDLRGEWRTAPLGEVSRILLGRDAGWRGDMTLAASLLGTVGSNTIHAAIRLTDIHRNTFVPAHLLTLTAQCDATLASAFTSMPTVHCVIPSPAGPPALTLTTSLPDLRRLEPGSLDAELAPTPASVLVPILQTFSTRIPPRLNLAGTLSGDLSCDSALCDPAHLDGTLMLEDGSLAIPDDKTPITLGDLTLHTPAPPTLPVKPVLHRTAFGAPPAPAQNASLILSPTTIALGARDPASIEGRLDLHGFTLHLSGNTTEERLRALTTAFPPFGDGLPPSPTQTPTPQPIHLDLIATRPWQGPQTWHEATPTPISRQHPHPAKHHP